MVQVPSCLSSLDLLPLTLVNMLVGLGRAHSLQNGFTLLQQQACFNTII